ncbi:MAG TPA: hypothetical protein VGB24_14420 [Longimicrobium sp.]|jgi:hypothetical protein
MQNSSLSDAPRRPYRRPALTVFGDMRELTLASISQNMNDPGQSSQTMT